MLDWQTLLSKLYSRFEWITGFAKSIFQNRLKEIRVGVPFAACFPAFRTCIDVINQIFWQTFRRIEWKYMFNVQHNKIKILNNINDSLQRPQQPVPFDAKMEKKKNEIKINGYGKLFEFNDAYEKHWVMCDKCIIIYLLASNIPTEIHNAHEYSNICK